RMEEDKYFAEGRYVEVFPFDAAWSAGLLVCADIWNPALVHLAALQGATVLLSPVASAVEAVGGEFSNPEGWDTALRFYAM
ncbi:NAD+ synthetase, partial [Halomonas sp. SIMBA_159]